MPVIYQKKTERGWLLLWRITETVEQLTALATPEERARASAISSVTRRCHWLAWRAALRSRMPGAVIEYDAAGGPVLAGGCGYIGASHTDGLAAVIWDPEEPCAVDVERLERNFDRVASKYLAPEEEALSGGDPRFRAVAWCAKETLYKYARVKGADLLHDVRVLGFWPVAENCREAGAGNGSPLRGEESVSSCCGEDEREAVYPEGCLTGGVPGDRRVGLRFFTPGEFVVVYTPGTFFV